ncbi:MAG TPA: ABC transporter substrate-binding protein [Candidatus Methanoperedens sp.]|nr:ABC transporter substrate-binding protein [Candidatus Methanoperedens sp.]
MRRSARLAQALLAACALVVAACGGNAAPDPGTLVVGLEANPTNLDPRLATGAAAVRLIPLLFNSLLRLDPAGEPAPELALSWESPSPTEYVLHLRDGVRFHDGRPLTAADVKYTYDWMRDPKNHSPNQGALAVVAAVEAPDPATVRFTLREPFASFLQNLTLGIVPAHLGDAPGFADAPVGSGPFRWGEWQPGERLVVLAFDGAWEARPRLDRVVFRIVANETTRLLEARRGRIDLLWNNVPPYAVPFLREGRDLAVTTRPGITYQYLGFNLGDKILGDVRVRRAIAHAVDRERIVRALYFGLARPATTLLAPENWAHAGDVPVFGHDPALARRLLDEAGFPPRPDGSRFALSYKTSTDRQGIEMADLIAEDLAAVGIRVERRSYEWGTFYGDIKAGNFQLYSLRWVGITDPDQLHYVFHSASVPPAGANRGRYANAEVDRLLEASRRESDSEARRAQFAEAQRLIAADCVYVSLWHPDDIYALATRFEGFEPYPGGQYTSLKKVRPRS